MEQGKRGRITYFDWLRGVATYMVIVLHMCNMMLSTHTVAQLGVPLVLAWSELQLVFTRWAVPAFLMITGALLLDPRRKIDFVKIARYAGRMLCVLLLFCPVYACVSARSISLQAIVQGWVDALTQGSWDHLWYVYALIGLYLLTPLLALYVRSATREQECAVLVMLAVTTLVVPTVNYVLHTNIATFVWVTYPLFYYLLGSYAHRYLRLDTRVTVLGLGALVACALAIVLFTCVGEQYPRWLIRPQSPLLALWALYVFVAARAIVDGRDVPKPLSFASEHSLVIYLLHPIAFVFLYRRLWWFPYETLPPVLFELVVLAIVYGVTLPMAAALKRVPVLRRIL